MVLERAAPVTVAELGEDGLIEIFAADPGAISPTLLVPNGDDAAAFMLDPRYASVITTDTLVEGVHFDLAYTPPHKLGRKLLAVNLSDLAAMGARPKFALLSVTMPPSTLADVARGIASGIREHARLHGVTIIGGNTTRTTGPMVLTAILIGRCEPDQLVRRRGTQLGDALFVTGQVGSANGGLRVAKRGGPLPGGDHPFYPLVSALLDPVPRVSAGRALAKQHLVHAMCDVSDGLGRDLRRLLEPEGLGARIEAHNLPMSDALRQLAAGMGTSPELMALEGGEDYELLFTADPHDEREIVRVLAEVGTPVTRIGTVIAERELEVFMPDGSVISPPSGYDHFPKR
ncbi:thiamine-phosphate kinase [Myxococcota bacterium]|nr:thiamine-phosphate kinase [Myxococcota bacterium]